MKVSDLVLNFRAALVGLIPRMEQAGVPWKRPYAYDDWDSVATALYDALVGGVIKESVRDRFGLEVRIPPYDLMQHDYQGFGRVEVVHSSLGPGSYVFHALGTNVEAFDIVEAIELSNLGLPCSEELLQCPVAGASFAVRLVGADSDSEIVFDEL